MKLLDAILLALAAGFFIIGVHQTITAGIAYSYWPLMLALGMLYLFQYRKKSGKS
ncbi:hypothetical protein AB9P05_07365 [Roseivirga sp. BDSF3-8]|uniref:hypothetical protein n=1 Tax=Roseivirga sp. BDSF3-8 TaxID=3241598 RepID=UPI003532167C